VHFNLILKYKGTIFRIISLIFCLLTAELINAQSPISDSLKHNLKESISKSIKDTSTQRAQHAQSLDSLKTVDSLQIPKSDIETRIQYSCSDSIRMEMAKQQVYLYGNSKVTYGTRTLEAEYLIINWAKNEVEAYGKTDTLTGKIIGRPVFREGAESYVADSIRYNMKSGKGLIKGIVTKQGEGYIHGGPVKRTPEAVYVKHALYTTCNLPHPHFSINATKLKVIPGDKVVTGPFHMEIMGIPTPLGLPLGFFPVTKRSKSGIIMPTVGESRSRGFFLSNGGYYWAVNDYVGAKVVGDIYANQSYRVSGDVNYIKRYNYTGKTMLSFSKVKDGFADSVKAPGLFSFRWNHTTLSNASAKLTADVNISSKSYYRANSYNPVAYQSTNFASNVSWAKAFKNSPFNLTIALRQNQNTLDSSMTVTFPEVNVSMNRIYPFKQKVGNGSKWFEKINVAYNGSTKFVASNKINNFYTGTEYTDTTLNIKNNFNEILDYGQWGVKNTVPIGTTVKLLKYLSFNPTINLENWIYAEKLNYDTIKNTNGTYRVQASSQAEKGFNAAFSGNFTAALTTRIYGMYRINSKVMPAIRHTFIPTATYTFQPDLVHSARGDAYFYTNPAVTNNGKVTPYSRYAGYLYGGPGSGTVNSLSVSLRNTFEAKIRNRKDTTGTNGTKKLQLLENLGAAGAYNFSADSLNWSTISILATSNLFNRVNFNFTSTFDPYVTVTTKTGSNYTNTRTKTFSYEENGPLLKLTNYTLYLGSNLNPKGQKSLTPTRPSNSNQSDYMMGGMGQYVDFNIPWNLFIGYNIGYSKLGTAPSVYTNSFTFTGDVKVSDNWKLNVTTGYDVIQKKLGFTTIQIMRDLHCWQMSLNVVPFGDRQSFFFTLNAKSSMLRDLKINKQNATYNGGY
jgi:hypothetical protein